MVQGLKFKPNFNSNVDDDINKKCTKKGMVQGLRFELNNGDNLRFRNSRGDNSIKKDFNNINEQNDVHYKFSTCFEKCVFVLGLFTAVICGFVQPIMNELYGEFMTLLVGRFTKDSIMSEPLILSYFGGGKTTPNATTEDQMAFLIADGKAYFLSSVILGIIQLIVSFLMITCLGYYALKKVGKMRRFFLEALFQQDIAWHDKENTGAGLASTMAQLDTLRDGLNENLGMVVYLITSFIVNVAVAFLVAWKLTLILVIVSPIFLGASGLLNKKKNTMYLKESDSCKSASAVAQEVLSSIRTVVAFNGEEKEVKRYEEHLNVAKKLSILSNVYSGLGNGVTWMLMFMTYAICFWFGTPLILADRLNEEKSYTPGAVATVLFCMSVATLNIGLLAPYLESLIKARTASHGVLRVLGRKSQINPFSTSGKEIDDKLGTIEFRNVHFSYPTRPNVKVLQGLDLKINQGESVALVGASGSGKSTTIQLLERFYNPDSGSILLNGVDVSELRLSWLRRQIGLVGQEPVLFNTTIAKNICGDLDVSYEEMVRAAQDANVHEFISSLPEGYETIVGEHGSRFSGGQKQRIAIARALVRKPSILLLDEATSALDVASEGIVQNALDRASQGRTTITIAHRLSSIQNVDRIVVIEEGKAVEQGTHQELMEKQGKYYSLVSADATLQHNIKNKEIDTKDENEKDTEDILLEPHLNPNADEETVVQSKEPGVSWTRLWQLNKPDVGYLIVGSLGSLVVGIASPLSALLYGNYNFALSGEDEKYVIRMANMYALCFVAVAVIVFFSIFLQFSLLGLAGARLTNRLRVSVFGVILKQDMSWFDEDRNCVSTLTTRLSSDANTIQDASGCKLGALMQAVGTIIIGIIMSLFYSWKMTLMCSMGVPIICASLVIEAVITKKTNNELRVCIEQASKVAIEGMSNIRTVASLGLEPMITEHYNMKLKTAEKSQIVMTRYRGVVFALGYSSINIAYSFAIYYSVYLIVHESLPFINTIIVSETILFGTWLVVQLLTLAPNISAGRNAAGRLFNILDRKPQIYNPPYDTGKMPSGDVLYSQVRFSYPKRPDTVILKGLDLNIIRGQTVALVGLSGSGKSTCIQLLQRFYDPVSGTVSIGEKDITAASIHRVRAEIGIVSQEPVLFDRTIAENIAYGDNTRIVEINEIIDAAKKANVHDFINSLPAGYETRLGTRGMQLSGGQKQRIAIARALIRNPSILILDEATSALDTQNEKIVQEALEGATDGRTCIMIAHRLSTVARCDVIYVLSNGEVVESGTHSELLALNKHYAQLLRQQQS